MRIHLTRPHTLSKYKVFCLFTGFVVANAVKLPLRTKWISTMLAGRIWGTGANILLVTGDFFLTNVRRCGLAGVGAGMYAQILNAPKFSPVFSAASKFWRPGGLSPPAHPARHCWSPVCAQSFLSTLCRDGGFGLAGRRKLSSGVYAGPTWRGLPARKLARDCSSFRPSRCPPIKYCCAPVP